MVIKTTEPYVLLMITSQFLLKVKASMDQVGMAYFLMIFYCQKLSVCLCIL